MNTEEFNKISVSDDIRLAHTDKSMGRELQALAVIIAILFYLWWRMI